MTTIDALDERTLSMKEDMSEIKIDVKSLSEKLSSLDKKMEGMSKYAAGAGATAALFMIGLSKILSVGLAYIR